MTTATAIPANLVRRNRLAELRDQLLEVYGIDRRSNTYIPDALPPGPRGANVLEAMYAINRVIGYEEDLEPEPPLPCFCDSPANVGFFCSCCDAENTVDHECRRSH